MQEIPLTNSNKLAKVDDEDAPWVNQYDWYLTPEGYAARDIGEGQFVYMHEEIMARAGEIELPVRKVAN